MGHHLLGCRGFHAPCRRAVFESPDLLVSRARSDGRGSRPRYGAQSFRRRLFHRRRLERRLSDGQFGSRPEQVVFFVPIILNTFMLAFKKEAGMGTVAWGVEGVLIFLLALAVKE